MHFKSWIVAPGQASAGPSRLESVARNGHCQVAVLLQRQNSNVWTTTQSQACSQSEIIWLALLDSSLATTGGSLAQGRSAAAGLRQPGPLCHSTCQGRTYYSILAVWAAAVLNLNVHCKPVIWSWTCCKPDLDLSSRLYCILSWGYNLETLPRHMHAAAADAAATRPQHVQFEVQVDWSKGNADSHIYRTSSDI